MAVLPLPLPHHRRRRILQELRRAKNENRTKISELEKQLEELGAANTKLTADGGVQVRVGGYGCSASPSFS